MTARKKVLVVDDDASLLDIICLSFSVISDIDVLKATQGEEGINSARINLPDLIIMDYKMPGMDGWEAARILKEGADTKHIPIIGYTAWASLDDVKKGLQAGLSEIITKPYDLDAWETKLKKYL